MYLRRIIDFEKIGVPTWS